jgi:diguanylate cyclase (GGDEF)-like protein
MFGESLHSIDLPAMAAMVLAVAALSLTAAGLRQPRYRGFEWWVAALWLTAGGAAGAMATPARSGLLLCQGLLMQWPVLVLVGLRRFHARHELPLNEKADWAVLGLALACGGAALAWPAAGVQPVWVAAAGAMALHQYAAALLFLGPPGRNGTPLQALGAAIAVAGFAPILVALPSGSGVELLHAQTLAASLGGIVTAFVALTLVSERTHQQLRDSHRRLRVLANVDALTQVPNRRHFEDLARRALTQDPPASAALLLFDIDHFKQINDRLGHAAGDRALRLVSASMRAHLRMADVAGRHGGDEFALLLRNAGTRDAMGVAARIVADVQRNAGNYGLPTLTLSFGMVSVAPREALDEALRRADQALYEAKRQGRSRAVAAEGDEDQPVFSESQRLGLSAC